MLVGESSLALQYRRATTSATTAVGNVGGKGAAHEAFVYINKSQTRILISIILNQEDISKNLIGLV